MIAERTGVAPFSAKDKDNMKEMDEELAIVIKDFQNAMNVELLRQAKRIGRHSLSQYSARPFMTALCRAGASIQAAYTYRHWLRPEP